MEVTGRAVGLDCAMIEYEAGQQKLPAQWWLLDR